MSATHIPTAEHVLASALKTPRGRFHRLAFWRSPEDQPRWARPALLAIAALAAALYAWNIADSGYAYFYSVAVKSMSVSWKAFFYGALDPKATITIDKLAGSFAPQALSARIFGFHQWALALPQVIEGVISVLAMYRVVRRWFGVPAGLLAAGIFALAPILASMYGHPMEDGLLTMCLVLAADSFQRAVSEARLRSLLWAGLWVGVGFQAKMLQAWMILPALAITYLIVAPAPVRRRLMHLVVAGAVTVAVSLSWILLFTVTPAADRPYVDGSTDNSAFAMVFGYNGLERLGINVPGSVASMFGGSGGGQIAPVASGAGTTGAPGPGDAPGGFPGGQGGQGGGGFPGGGFPSGGSGFPGGNASGGGSGFPGGGGRGGPAAARLGGASSGFGSTQGWTKLLGVDYGTQIGWLYPLTLLSLVLGFAWHRRRGRTDQIRGGFLFWGLWLATYAAIFSKITLPHTAYLASLAPPIAALSAAGIVLLWRAYREGNGRAVWALPLAIALEAAWTLHLSSGYSNFLPWLTPVVVTIAAISILLLVVARFSTRIRHRVLIGGMIAGIAAMLVTPGAWAASVLDGQYGGSAFNASAGPGGTMGGGPGGGGLLGSATLTAAQIRLDDYLTAHLDGAEFVAATESWTTAAPYITATGQAFLPMGGFSGSVPEPTLAKVEQLVAQGRLRYFLLGSTGIGRSSGTVSSIASWVTSSCTAIPASAYGDATGSAPTNSGPNSGPATDLGGAQSLYLCAKGA